MVRQIRRGVAVLGACLGVASSTGCFYMQPSPATPVEGDATESPADSSSGEPAASQPQSSDEPRDAASAAPSIVSVTIRNKCRETVKVFYGDKPKFGSGTLSSLSGNSVQSHVFQPGDMFWLVDESENGISSVTVGAGMREIEVTDSCTGLTSR